MWLDIMVDIVIIVIIIMDEVDENLLMKDNIVRVLLLVVRGMVKMKRLGFEFLGKSFSFMIVIGIIKRFIIIR